MIQNLFVVHRGTLLNRLDLEHQSSTSDDVETDGAYDFVPISDVSVSPFRTKSPLAASSRQIART